MRTLFNAIFRRYKLKRTFDYGLKLAKNGLPEEVLNVFNTLLKEYPFNLNIRSQLLLMGNQLHREVKLPMHNSHTTYEEALQAQTALEDKLLKDPNVVSIGVVKDMDAAGHKTDNHVVEVGIIASSVEHTIPREYILHLAEENKNKHVRICVVEVGIIKSLHSTCVKPTLSKIEVKLPINARYNGIFFRYYSDQPKGLNSEINIKELEKDRDQIQQVMVDISYGDKNKIQAFDKDQQSKECKLSSEGRAKVQKVLEDAQRSAKTFSAY